MLVALQLTSAINVPPSHTDLRRIPIIAGNALKGAKGRCGVRRSDGSATGGYVQATGKSGLSESLPTFFIMTAIQ
ncbi:hypothetical protein [uncultured Sphingomonas sp.]|uniref:hypothetical protein n=1 Tax=uncultured Sphingomonas sp. TaxID=158754 RepID=UPI0025E6AF84|nr:hypothetical protein [uncultured Sphingomonas sp.]